MGNFVEQAHVLADEVHREIDVAAAVKDNLAFGFVDKAVARRNPDRFICGVHIKPDGFACGQRLGQCNEMYRAEIVGHHLQL